MGSQAMQRALAKVAAVAILTTPSLAQAATVQVNDASDTLHLSGCAATGVGTCTLRDAITFSNANPGTDMIVAAPELSGAAINLTAPLPAILDTVSLDGEYPGRPPVPIIHIVGTGAGAGAHGLVIQASGSLVNGIEIEGFASSGIKITGDRNKVGSPRSYVALMSRGSGNSIHDNGSHGIEIIGGSDNEVSNNRVTGNQGAGIYVAGGAARNIIGRVSETTQVSGVFWYNILSRNGGAGIQIGKDVNDSLTLANRTELNQFEANRGLPIDLAGDDITRNDPGDVDTGPNGLQNAPVIAIRPNGNGYTVDGVLDSSASIPFQAFAQGNPRSGQPFLALATPSGQTDANGHATFSFELEPDTCALAVTVATPSGFSELSNSVVAASLPAPLPLAPSFHTLTPCRVVDTRIPTFQGVLAPLDSGVPRSFVFNSCGIPTSAKVLSVNLTVTDPMGAGFLTFGVGACPQVETSVVNFTGGQTRANNAIINLLNGTATATASVAGRGSVHLVVDVNGYFE